MLYNGSRLQNIKSTGFILRSFALKNYIYSENEM